MTTKTRRERIEELETIAKEQAQSLRFCVPEVKTALQSALEIIKELEAELKTISAKNI